MRSSEQRLKMHNRAKASVVIGLIQAVFLLAFASATIAQAPVQENGSVREGNPLVLPQSAQTPPEKPQGITAGEPRPLYGLQGVIVETLDGKTVASQSADQPFNPASTIKLATALIALRTLGPQYRFATGVWTDGTINNETGTLTGNLYVSGRDPSFHYEHAVMLARQLNSLGIKTITGNLVVTSGFTMNFISSARRSGEQLCETLDTRLRSPEALRSWTYERTVLNDRASLETIPSVVVMGEVQTASAPPSARLVLTQKSSKLVDILKVLLCYSNNFMAERIGDTLGGPESVRRQLIALLVIPPDTLKISSLSGLGVNRVTPQDMMKIFKSLRDELQKNGLTPSDVMPVAGIDPGTMQDRFTGLTSRGSVIAKTGTLARTDGGASSLVGQLKAANGEVLLFVIMNQRGSVWKFRENQDYLIMQIQGTRGGPKAFDYRPLTLTMQLSDTESTLESNDDFGPKSQSEMHSP